MLLLAKQSLDEAPYKLSGAVMKLAGITFRRLAFSWTDKPWFLTEGKFAAILIIPSSWGFQLNGDLHQHRRKQQRIFLAPLPGKKKTSARGVLNAHPLLCLLFCFTLFLLASFYQK
jgi:hypothetical protein